MFYNTDSRVKILELLKSNKEKSFSAEEIFREIAYTGVGKSTVFRQLAKLVSSSELRRLADGDKRSVRYQYLDKEHCATHLHLKCSVCGKLIHLDKKITHIFGEKIKNASNFLIDPSAFIPGFCENCAFQPVGKEKI